MKEHIYFHNYSLMKYNAEKYQNISFTFDVYAAGGRFVNDD